MNNVTVDDIYNRVEVMKKKQDALIAYLDNYIEQNRNMHIVIEECDIEMSAQALKRILR